MIGEDDDDGHGEATATEAFDWTEEVSTFGDRLARARAFAGREQAPLAAALGGPTDEVRELDAGRP